VKKAELEPIVLQKYRKIQPHGRPAVAAMENIRKKVYADYRNGKEL